MRKVLVLNLVGLTRDLLHSGAMPAVHAFSSQRKVLEVVPPLPAVTCTSQADMLMGCDASKHGAVANGWYFRELSEIWLWRQSVKLIDAGGSLESVLQRWKRRYPDSTTAQIFWWWNLPGHADFTLTPRPTYYADGRKGPDTHSSPPSLRQELQDKLGDFPLFRFWGPGADIASTRWIAEAVRYTMRTHTPGLVLGYLPHLDYDLQRFGPNSDQARSAAAELDKEVARLLQEAELLNYEVILLSEYGIEEVHTAVFPNQALRTAGLLEIHPARNGALLDPGNSRAFAVCDHQVAHVYVQDQSDIEGVRILLEGLPGVEAVHERSRFAELGLDHPRSGELVMVAAPGHWFAYPYWVGKDAEPDFARTVDIHRKPGYDPCELLFDPAISFIKPRLALKLLGKMLGQRTLMNVIPTDTSLVRGSHGRSPSSVGVAPIWIGPEELAPSGKKIAAADVFKRLAAASD